MTKLEYDKIMEIIDKIGRKEDEYCNRHCELNKDNAEEVNRRRHDAERFKTALWDVSREVKAAFYRNLD